MVFNVAIAFSGLKTKKGKEYAIMLADTVIARPDSAEVLTGKIPRKYEEISYALNGDDVAEDRRPNAMVTEGTSQITTSKRHKELPKFIFDEAKRREHQKELREQKAQELLERFSSGSHYGDKTKQKVETEKLVSYRNADEMPAEIKRNQVYVDMKRDSIVCPINGKMVPFHVSLIKNINKQEEDRNIVSLRINFHLPSSSALSTISFPQNTDPNLMYIKELTFKSKSGKNVADVIKKVKDLQKKIKEKATEKDEKNVVFNPEEDPLVLIKGKRPVLQDLKVRPNVSGKKTSGNLEAHANGFRFMSKKSEQVDITFKNVKHAFFQPCDNEMIIILHFNLHKPLLIGKKKTYDVQFYTEAGLQAEDLDTRRRGGHDDDEYEQEEKERAQRKKLNEEFLSFTRAVEAAAGDQIEFDKPYRELAFQGAPFKSNVYLYPTVHCLVNLSETPFFVLPLDEVEVAHFERVSYGLRNFDLNFIYKDYTKPVMRVCAIPSNYLEAIKNWLDKMDVIFSESVVNFDWNKILGEVRAQIRENVQNFVAEGGWDFLQPSASENGGDGGLEEGDSEFEASDDDFEDESESEFSDDEDEDFEESDFDGDEELDEEGMSWDEMEDLAEEEDERVTRNTKSNSKAPMRGSKNPPKKLKK